MKKRTFSLTFFLFLLLGFCLVPNTSRAADSVDMFRLYNPNTGEHFYTSLTAEKNMLTTNGWQYEGIGWVAPTSGDSVYRLYNRNSGDHHYTMNVNEKEMLQNIGWRYEGVGWYSSKNKEVPLYRAYNPNVKVGSHNYTPNQAEQNSLIRLGWKDEGLAWYGIGQGQTLPPVTNPPVTPPTNETTVYIAPNSGKKYHLNRNCRGLKNAKSIVSISLSDAINKKYEKCGWE